MLEAEPSNDPGNDPNPNPAPSGDPSSSDPGKKGDDPGGGELSWDKVKEYIPEDIRQDSAMSTITSLEGLAKSYVHAQKSLGKDKFTIPDKHATPEDWNALFSKLGNPEKLDDYTFNLEDEASYNEEVMNKVKQAAHEAGVLPWQFEKIVNTFNKEGSQILETNKTNQEAQFKEQVENLKKEWGDQYDTKIRKANIAFKEFMPDKAEREAFIEAGLGSDPRVVKVLAKASEHLAEDVFLGHGDGKLGGMTPDEALSKAREIQGNPKHPYRDPTHPNHKQAKEEVANLYKVAFPE